ncbi:uncharacterized protein [Ptychodera flava]|uniref:uncharacterized protein n=1 Tax=Ptychodera flava TaxID=63121 RepID=UPI00396A5CA9
MGCVQSQEPMEVAGAICSKCGKDLPEIRGWRDIKIKTIYGKPTHEFLRGAYYREKIPTAKHVCHTCFWTPDHILKRRESEKAEAAKAEAEIARANAEVAKAEAARAQAMAEAAKAEALKAAADAMKAKALAELCTKSDIHYAVVQ